MLKLALALVTAVSEAAFTGGMRLLAKENPNIAVQIFNVDPVVIHNGANKEAIRNQVELAVRRCGFTITPDAKAGMYVSVGGHSQGSRGYYGHVNVGVLLGAQVGGDDAAIHVFDSGAMFSGPPGTAGKQLRELLAQLLDEFCNDYLRTRDEVWGKAGRP